MLANVLYLRYPFTNFKSLFTLPSGQGKGIWCS